jgi:DNA anti-recombination protein RmuC
MSELTTLSLVLLGSLLGAAIVWYAMNQRTARLLDSAVAKGAADIAAAEAREIALNEAHERARTQMQDAFTVAAGEAMRKVVSQAEEDKEKSFTAATSALSESMKGYVEALDKVEKAGIARDAALRNEVESVSKLGLSLADETRELSLALRGDSQAQGAWGEVVVENLLQSMGFIEGRDYHKQLSETAADRTRKRTDFVLTHCIHRFCQH